MKTMEKQPAPWQRRGLLDLMSRRRRDPGGDLPFDPDEDPPQEDGEEPMP